MVQLVECLAYARQLVTTLGSNPEAATNLNFSPVDKIPTRSDDVIRSASRSGRQSVSWLPSCRFDRAAVSIELASCRFDRAGDRAAIELAT